VVFEVDVARGRGPVGLVGIFIWQAEIAQPRPLFLCGEAYLTLRFGGQPTAVGLGLDVVDINWPIPESESASMNICVVNSVLNV
jgi:hypothetical protein